MIQYKTANAPFLPGVSHDVSERPTLQELHDNPQLVSHQVAVVHVDHIFVMVVPHDHHLKHKHTEEDLVFISSAPNEVLLLQKQKLLIKDSLVKLFISLAHPMLTCSGDKA